MRTPRPLSSRLDPDDETRPRRDLRRHRPGGTNVFPGEQRQRARLDECLSSGVRVHARHPWQPCVERWDPLRGLSVERESGAWQLQGQRLRVGSRHSAPLVLRSCRQAARVDVADQRAPPRPSCGKVELTNFCSRCPRTVGCSGGTRREWCPRGRWRRTPGGLRSTPPRVGREESPPRGREAGRPATVVWGALTPR